MHGICKWKEACDTIAYTEILMFADSIINSIGCGFLFLKHIMYLCVWFHHFLSHKWSHTTCCFVACFFCLIYCTYFYIPIYTIGCSFDQEHISSKHGPSVSVVSAHSKWEGSFPLFLLGMGYSVFLLCVLSPSLTGGSYLIDRSLHYSNV